MVRVAPPSSSRSSSLSGRHYPPPSPPWGVPNLHEPMLPIPPTSGGPAPLGHLGQPPPPPPPPRLHEHYQPYQFGRRSLREPMLSPPPVRDSADPQAFISGNQLLRHNYPPPPFHGHDREHHESMPVTPPALESADPHRFENHHHSFPPPPLHHLYDQIPSHSPPPPPRPGHGHRLPHNQFGRPPLDIDPPHLFTDHLRRSHSPPPPPPPPPGHSHPSPFHGRRHHAEMDRVQQLKEALTNGMGHSPPHHFTGHIEGISSLMRSEHHHPPPPPHGEMSFEHPDVHGHVDMPRGAHHPREIRGAHARHFAPPPPPPSHKFGGGRREHFDDHGHINVSHEMDGAYHSYQMNGPLAHHHRPPPPPPSHEMGMGHYGLFNVHGHGFMEHHHAPPPPPPPPPSHEMGIGHYGLSNVHDHGYMDRSPYATPHFHSPPPKHRRWSAGPPTFPPFGYPFATAFHRADTLHPHLAVPVY